ncbi:HNH endonuclease [Streptomyces sp. NPDC056112]|uniref:HNH endonuclease n=1 Tax=Streptomyces sp. NPDC056112 TaxID=3345715 RepID=UPI0035D5B38F
MAVTKRLRYEVLRRDNYTCRYCGGTAPDVKLTVDHVVPQALGGSDDPTNLVTACESCNNGKTSVPADAPVVASVSEDALRWATAMKKAAEIAHGDHQARLAYRNVFHEAWSEWSYGPEHAKKPVHLPDGWPDSLDMLREAGLPDWELSEAVRAAMAAKKVTPENTFRYFCGVCWKKVRNLQETAQAMVRVGGPSSEEQEEAKGPLEHAGIMHQAAWDMLLTLYPDGFATSMPLNDLECLEFGDEITNALQMIAEVMRCFDGVPELEQRFRRGRSWNDAAEAVEKAFQIMLSEQPHLISVDGKSEGLPIDEIREVLDGDA